MNCGVIVCVRTFLVRPYRPDYLFLRSGESCNIMAQILGKKYNEDSIDPRLNGSHSKPQMSEKHIIDLEWPDILSVGRLYCISAAQYQVTMHAVIATIPSFGFHMSVHGWCYIVWAYNSTAAYYVSLLQSSRVPLWQLQYHSTSREGEYRVYHLLSVLDSWHTNYGWFFI